MRGIDLRQLRRRARPKILLSDMRAELQWDNNRLSRLENSEVEADPVDQASYVLALNQVVARKARQAEVAAA